MATIAIDVNDVVGMNAAVLRILNETVGDTVTMAFISQYEKPHVRSDRGCERSHLTVAQIAAALERGKAQSAALNASVTEHGDYTKERREMPQPTNEEAFADIMRLQTEAASA